MWEELASALQKPLPLHTTTLTSSPCWNCSSIVVNHLDSAVREAYRLQKEMVSPKEFRDVKSGTEKRVLQFLLDQVPVDTIPHIQFFCDLLSILAENYKYVFWSDPMQEVSPGQWMRRFTFRGTGGPSGIKTLPKILQQSFRRLRDSGMSCEYSREVRKKSPDITCKWNPMCPK
jgi:hypothetical protein